MKKVLVFGIHSNYLLDELGKLNSEYDIVGYVDYEFEFATKMYCYKPFYFPEEIKNVEFDVIIILAKTRQENERKLNSLKLLGISEYKILSYYFWGGLEKKIVFSNHIEGLKNLDLKFSGYILGMSHSWLGVFSHLFSEPTYKLSWNSSDLHFHYHVIKEVFTPEYTDKSELKYVIWDLPYYIFNYDFSQNKLNGKKGLTFWKQWKDYNHFCDRSDLEYQNYQLYISMFGEKEKRRDDLCHVDDITNSRTVTKEEIENYKEKISHVWNIEHTETIRENIHYFKAAVSAIKCFNPDIKIIVTVFPQPPYLEDTFPDEVKKTKDFFYEQMNKNEDVMVWDYFSYFSGHEEYFRDVTHLNCVGADLFTKELNKRIKQEIL